MKDSLFKEIELDFEKITEMQSDRVELGQEVFESERSGKGIDKDYMEGNTPASYSQLIKDKKIVAYFLEEMNVPISGLKDIGIDKLGVIYTMKKYFPSLEEVWVFIQKAKDTSFSELKKEVNDWIKERKPKKEVVETTPEELLVEQVRQRVAEVWQIAASQFTLNVCLYLSEKGEEELIEMGKDLLNFRSRFYSSPEDFLDEEIGEEDEV